MSDPINRNYIDPNNTMWLSQDGTLHCDAVRCCEMLGIPPTRENQGMIEETCRKVIAEHMPDVPVRSAYDLL